MFKLLDHVKAAFLYRCHSCHVTYEITYTPAKENKIINCFKLVGTA